MHFIKGLLTTVINIVVVLLSGQGGGQPDYTQAWAEYYRQQGYYYPYQQQPGQPQQPGIPGQQPPQGTPYRTTWGTTRGTSRTSARATVGTYHISCTSTSHSFAVHCSLYIVLLRTFRES